jgi:hypothetical protein
MGGAMKNLFKGSNSSAETMQFKGQALSNEQSTADLELKFIILKSKTASRPFWAYLITHCLFPPH